MEREDHGGVPHPPQPYQGLSLSHLRLAHDRIYFGAWRGSAPTLPDLQNVYLQLGRFLDLLEQELRPDSPGRAKEYLAKARVTHHQANPDSTAGSSVLLAINNTLSYGHRVMDILLQARGEPIHMSREFAQYYDVAREDEGGE